MTSHELLEELRGLPLLTELPEELLEQLARIGRIEEFPAAGAIFRQGEPARTIYLLLRGCAALEICTPGGGCKRILTVAEGELLGWSPALGQLQMTATARALTDVRAVAISGAQLLAECEQNPRLGFEFMKRAALALTKRLNATRLQLLDLYGAQMPAAPDWRDAAGPASSGRS